MAAILCKRWSSAEVILVGGGLNIPTGNTVGWSGNPTSSVAICGFRGSKAGVVLVLEVELARHFDRTGELVACGRNERPLLCVAPCLETWHSRGARCKQSAALFISSRPSFPW
jgi:hypothetical protein